jgi:small subunit ribosomal protein S1
MSDDTINDNNNEEEESFADLFEAYNAGMKDDLQLGDKISGKIISIGNDSVFIDTGTKVDGVVEKAELLDEQQELSFKIGDEIILYVVAMDEHEIRLSKAVSGIGGLEILRQAFESAIPVEGKVAATCKGGFYVEMTHRRAFCPVSQMDVKYIETPEDYVGNTFEFLIIQFEEDGKNIVVSRRKLLEQSIEKESKVFFATLKQGDIIDGRITKVMPYGAFVELIPGVEGMVHISELSWARAEKPEEIVRANDKVSVKVIDISEGEGKNRKKISLSVRQATKDPWDTITDMFEPGDKVTGKVIRCMDFGVFVEIAPGIEGLVHISEISYVKRIVKIQDVVSVGEMVPVTIKQIDAANRRISLSIRDAQGDPWLEVKDNISAGQVIKGTVEKKEGFGFFVALAPGVTGLLPKSNIKKAEDPGSIEKLNVGDVIVVTVEDIRISERKISLLPAASKDQGEWKDFMSSDAAQPASDLAEKLKKALASKNSE